MKLQTDNSGSVVLENISDVKEQEETANPNPGFYAPPSGAPPKQFRRPQTTKPARSVTQCYTPMHFESFLLPENLKIYLLKVAQRICSNELYQTIINIETIEGAQRRLEAERRNQVVRNETPAFERALKQKIIEVENFVFPMDEWPNLAAQSALSSLDTEKFKEEMLVKLREQQQRLHQGEKPIDGM